MGDFKHFNNWEYVFPKRDACFSNDLMASIINYFNEYHFLLKGQKQYPEGNVLFSLVEITTVNINNLKGIGDTFLFSSNSAMQAKEILSNYHELLKSIKDQGKNYITEYSNWYFNDAFLLQISQELPSTNVNSKIDYQWHPLGIASDEKSIENNMGEITKEHVISYLNDYAKKVIPILGLNKFPHSFILIKPISLKDPYQAFKPIGNFFIHIGLKEEVDEPHIANFLNLFILTWLKNHWSTIFEKLNFDNNSLITQRPFFEHQINCNDENEISTALNLYGSEGFNDFIYRFFEEDLSKGNTFKEELCQSIFPEIIRSFYKVKIKQQTDLSVFQSYVHTTSRDSFKKGYNYKLMRQFVITHFIIKTGILIFDLHFFQLIQLYRDSNQFISKYIDYDEPMDTATGADLKRYLQRDRLIYLGSSNPDKRASINKNLISSLSLFEATVFNMGRETVQILRDTNTQDNNPTNLKVLDSALKGINIIVEEKLGKNYPNSSQL